MRTLTALATLFTLTLTACDRPTAPDGPRPRDARRDAVTDAGDLLLYRPCNFDWSSEYFILCDLKVRNPDGSFTYVIQQNYRLSNASGPAQSWAPGGTAIAYSAWSDDTTTATNEEIFVVHVSDGVSTNLTNDPAADRSPSWSPDGARIAFVSDRDGGSDLYLMNADGSAVTRLTYGAHADRQASWSPDGTRLAFTCTVDTGNSDLCSVGADGSGLARLTTDPAADLDPAFSPDGTRLAFATNRFAPGTTDIATLSLENGAVTRLTSSPGIFIEPVWSAGGDRIAYVSGYVGACSDYCDNSILVMNADGTGTTVVDHGDGPAWSTGAAVQPPPGDAPPVARFIGSCNYLDCWFDGSASSDDHNRLVHDWSFGDGTTASGVVVTSHTYTAAGTYTVTLTVTDAIGQTGTATQVLTVTAPPPPDQPPVALFDAGCIGRTCTFDSSGSTDDHRIVSRAWSFGDGSSTVDVIAPSHAFPGDGTYQVTLTVTDDAGQTSTASRAVTVADLPPVARFTWSCAGTTCTLDGRSSTDDVGVVSYRWDMGKLGTAVGDVVSVQVRGRSSQAVTLAVTDGAMHTSSVSQTITAK